MSKARLVITAVLIEGRSQSQVARDCGACQSWISRLIARYTLDGDAAFEPRSRQPHTSPTQLPQAAIDLIIALRTELTGKGLDAGPHTIAWHLQHHHRLAVSVASISRPLHAAGLIQPSPHKRPKSSYIRFAAEQPHQTRFPSAAGADDTSNLCESLAAKPQQHATPSRSPWAWICAVAR